MSDTNGRLPGRPRKLLDISRPAAWEEDALCAQMPGDIWFPDHGRSTADAKELCRQCPVKDACLAKALRDGEEHGVWGGLDEHERARLGRKVAS